MSPEFVAFGCPVPAAPSSFDETHSAGQPVVAESPCGCMTTLYIRTAHGSIEPGLLRLAAATIAIRASRRSARLLASVPTSVQRYGQTWLTGRLSSRSAARPRRHLFDCRASVDLNGAQLVATAAFADRAWGCCRIALRVLPPWPISPRAVVSYGAIQRECRSTCAVASESLGGQSTMFRSATPVGVATMPQDAA